VTLAGVHPALKERIVWVRAIASEHYRVRSEITSGLRTRSSQERLYKNPEGYPVARPGCSSHEYGLAVDMVADSQWGQGALRWLAAAVGLYSPQNDPIHFALFDPQTMKHILPAACFAGGGIQTRLAFQNSTGGDPGEPQFLEPRRIVEFLTPAAARQ